MSYCVYRYWSPSGKSYIGKTNQGIVTRAGKNGYGYRVCPHFYNAIQEYGWDWFENHREILANDLTNDEADNLEQYYIKKFNSIKNGYNIQIGGSFNTRDMFVKPVVGINCFTKEVRIFESITEAKNELNIRSSKISAIAKHEGNYRTVGDYTWIYLSEWEGMSQEEKDKYFEIMPEFHSKGWQKYTRIVRLNDKKEYKTFIEAAKDSNITHATNIGKCLRGEIHTCGEMPDGTPIKWERRFLERGEVK